MRRRVARGGDDGITLIELLVGMLLAVIVLFAVGSLMTSLLTTPKTVTNRLEAANRAQLTARSLNTGIRNSSDFRLTNPVGSDQLLVARTAQPGSTISWTCVAWYFSATEGSVRYITSPTLILAPTSTQLTTWTTLSTGVTPSSGTGIFTVAGQKVSMSFKGLVAGQPTPQIMTTSVSSRAGNTGSPACY